MDNYITPKDLADKYLKSEKKIRKILRENYCQQKNWKNGYFWQIPNTEGNKILLNKFFG